MVLIDCYIQGNELFLTIVIVLSLIAIFSYKAYRQKQASWKGVLLKKRFFEDYEDGESIYTLIRELDLDYLLLYLNQLFVADKKLIYLFLQYF